MFKPYDIIKELKYLPSIDEVKDDDICTFLIELNEHIPKSDLPHRIRTMVIQKGDKKYLYKEDLGLSLGFRAKQLTIMCDNPVGDMREMADDEHTMPTEYNHFVDDDPKKEFMKKYTDLVFKNNQIRKHGRNYKTYGYGN